MAQQICYVTGMIFDLSGRILIGLHARDGLWGTLGGRLGIEEDPRAGLRREVLEESNATISDVKIVNAHCGPLTTTKYASSGETVNAMAVVFKAALDCPKARLRPDGTEIHALRWASLPDLEKHPLKPWMTLVKSDWQSLIT